MLCRSVLGVGLLASSLLVGCIDATTGDASDVGEVTREDSSEANEVAASQPKDVVAPKTDVLLAALTAAMSRKSRRRIPSSVTTAVSEVAVAAVSAISALPCLPWYCAVARTG